MIGVSHLLLLSDSDEASNLIFTEDQINIRKCGAAASKTPNLKVQKPSYQKTRILQENILIESKETLRTNRNKIITLLYAVASIIVAEISQPMRKS